MQVVLGFTGGGTRIDYRDLMESFCPCKMVRLDRGCSLNHRGVSSILFFFTTAALETQKEISNTATVVERLVDILFTCEGAEKADAWEKLSRLGHSDETALAAIIEEITSVQLSAVSSYVGCSF